jgi:hypothetical protein
MKKTMEDRIPKGKISKKVYGILYLAGKGSGLEK